ncbi:HIT family protein [Candidatus Gracilibacteria bacterium]|nr:HIT family protein [Candidatus Gracilibacteria bacterium]
MTSIFTQIIERKIPASIVYEDNSHIAFLDIYPFEKGHTLVVPKKEYETIMDMPEDEYLELQKIVLQIAKHYEKILGCGINVVQNNKAIAGQSVFHVHFHIIPRLDNSKPVFFESSEKYGENEVDIYREKLSLLNINS